MINLPSWAVSISKAGIWAMVAIWLLTVVINILTTDLVLVKATVADNGKHIQDIESKMNEADAKMSDFAADNQARFARIERLLYVMCVNDALNIAARDRCEATQK